MDPGVKNAIWGSIDKALSSFDYVDKEVFYQTLEAQYRLKPVEIPENYETFHLALRNIYGLRHHAIEREIVKVLHERSERGTYEEVDEIPAFIIIVESYFKEISETIEKSKVK